MRPATRGYQRNSCGRVRNAGWRVTASGELHRRWFANYLNVSGSGFAFRALVYPTDDTFGNLHRGTLICGSRNGLQARFVHSLWRLAATRLPSRALSVLVPVQAQRCLSTATPSQARLSAAWPTWPSASVTRTAADLVAGLTPQHATKLMENHRTLRSGGFLLSDAGQMTRCQDQEGA